MTAEEFRKIAPGLPSQPGIYKYADSKGRIIYVGKAKNIRKRVSSYFNKHLQGYKTHELVRNIASISFTIVSNEQDAFFLENSLIKELQPRYNIDLKDDKSYPFIVIKKEPFPRVFLTRKKIPDGSEYLGPFTSVGRVRELLAFIRQHIPLRTCKLNLTPRNIEKGKFKVCLEYHLGNCKGPCEGLQSMEAYESSIQHVREILRGKLGGIISSYTAEMEVHVKNLEFEKAQNIKKKLEHLERYQSRSVVVSQKLKDLDVFSLISESHEAFVNFLMVREGSVVQTHTLSMLVKTDETPGEVLAFAIAQIRRTFGSDAPEIVVPMATPYPGDEVVITVPRAGAKKQLLDLSAQNAKAYREEIRKKRLLHLEEASGRDMLPILQEMKTLLHLPELPLNIECFDNSNFQGSYPVSAMVSFKNGKPSKADYRKFNIKTVRGINDFASMKEAVYRRYKRLAAEDLEMPQLVIIDGGKGQLSAAVEAVHELGLDPFPFVIIGLAKNIEELFFPGDQESVRLPYNSASLRLIRTIRDEVHRFGITFHRDKRSKGTFKNELENIPGIGKLTAQQLLRKFRSVAKVKSASTEDLESLLGKAKAAKVRAYFEASE